VTEKHKIFVNLSLQENAAVKTLIHFLAGNYFIT